MYKRQGSLHLDNQVGLILLYTVLGLGTSLFIATGFIRSIPVSLEEAARIDGASTWRIFWTIIFPLMSPINATIAILTALWAWNDFLLPLIILTDQSNQTIPAVYKRQAISPVLVDDALEARTYEGARPLVPPPLRHHNLPDLRQLTY